LGFSLSGRRFSALMLVLSAPRPGGGAPRRQDVGGPKAALGRLPFAERVGAGDDIEELRRNLGLTGLSLGLAQLIELFRHVVVG
jgi:hypothetical protein